MNIRYKEVVVADALNMGSFLGWYQPKHHAQIVSFKADCDTVLWLDMQYVNLCAMISTSIKGGKAL